FIFEHSALPTRRVRSRLRLEILEDRLPPGDILLGIGMAFSSFGSEGAAFAEAAMKPGPLGGLDDGDGTATVSILAGDVERLAATTRTLVRIGHSPAAVVRAVDTTALMAWQLPAGHAVGAQRGVNANQVPSPTGPITSGNGLIALAMPATSLEQP